MVSQRIVSGLILLLIAMGVSPKVFGQAVFFNQDVRPILSEYCFACHGPDANHREADLRLDQRESAVELGAIVPGTSAESSLWERLNAGEGDGVMPPVETGKTLSDQQKEILQRWIEQGAEYEKHWSFEPVPERVPIPEEGAGWARNAVDHFVAARWKEQGLSASEAADRRTWLRRVSFDLTGLPPTIQQIEAFVADDQADAYEKVVDRLLASSAYGERMANMWLDVARYADTFGYQSDVEMEVWPWRDWVIRAFNQNLPYDQFLIQQLAGDLLPDATDETRLATAFHRLHRQTNEGGSIAEEFRLSGIADRTTTAGTAFLGLTLECCRCHDHKFDPVSQREFYQLSDYFSDIDEFGLYSHFTRAVPTPALMLYQGQQREQHRLAKEKREEAEAGYALVWKNAWDACLAELPQQRSLPPVPEPLFRMELEGDVEGVIGKATRCDGDNGIGCPNAPTFGRTSPFTYSLWVKPAQWQERSIVLHQSRAAEDSGFRGIQLTLENGAPQFSMIHFWPGDALRVQAKQQVPVDQWTHLAIVHDGSGTAAGVRLMIDGVPAELDVIRDKLKHDVRHRSEWGDAEAGSIGLALGARFRDIGFRNGSIDQLMIYDRQLSRLEVESIYRQPGDVQKPLSISDQDWCEYQVLTASEAVARQRKVVQAARDEEDKVATSVRQIMTMRHYDQAPATHVLHRGEYTEKGEVVEAGTPAMFQPLQAQGGDRLALAQWMVDPSHPLTSRVMVNRLWHQFFGRGIVVTLEDFGSQGSPPSHPQLLDYLARGLMDHQWDLHWVCREIVLSATYRQSSSPEDAAAFDRDPENRWLARGPKHRLSAEQLRDAVLAASGLLVDKQGGPSVKPYQPAGLWEEAGTGKSYHQDKGEGLYRRSMYTFWRRTAPPPSMLTFDATSRESCTARRELTTTPLQALVLLNDPQYVEASRVLAETLIQQHGEDLDGRWRELFLRLTGRPATDREVGVLLEGYREQKELFGKDRDAAVRFLKIGERPASSQLDPVELAAMTVVVQTVVTYDETIMLR